MVPDTPADDRDESTPDEPVDLDPESFETFLATHDLVLIDVWAEWCGPCKAMDPAVADIAAETSDLAVGKVDNEQYPDLLSDYRSLIGRVVSSLPALFLFVDGECVEQTTGRQSKADLEALVSEHR